ncbi:MAG: hypothetical protein IPL49_09170 [Saprospirales bacterium]|nr:hypothetical protein [Saprospirales bacterium]
MRTLTILFSLFLFSTTLFLGGCGPVPGMVGPEAMPLDYYVHREMTSKLRAQLADTSANWDAEASRKLVEEALAAMVRFDEAFSGYVIGGIKPPPPPPPPCSGCIRPDKLMIRPGAKWEGIQILNANKEVVCGFRLVEGASLPERAGLLVEPDLKAGMAIPTDGFLRVPLGDGTLDIPMNPDK